MKNKIIFIFLLFSVTAFSQTDTIFRASQPGGFDLIMTLPQIRNAILPYTFTGTVAANRIAYSTGSDVLTGSANLGWNGTKFQIGNNDVFTDNATLSVRKGASETYVGIFKNSAGGIVSAIDSLGWYYIRTGASALGMGGADASGNAIVGSSAVALKFNSLGASTFGGSDYWFGLNATATRTSGEHAGIRVQRTYQPGSGTGTWGGFTHRDVINQTGGATGISWGFWADPTLTNAADYRAFRYEETTGTGLYINGTSVNNYIGRRLFVGGTTTPTATLHLAAGTATASTAPLKFTSGTLLTTPEAGAVEFLTDKAYLTITTGAARKEIALNDAALTSGVTPVATTNGRLTDGVIIDKGAWTNTVTQSGSDTLLNAALGYGHFQRIGNVVSFTLRVEIALTSAGDANTVYIDPPIASDFTTAASDVIGTATMDPQSLSGANTQRQRCVVFASDSDDKIGISFDPVASLAYPENRMYISVSGSYVVQ